MHIKICGHVEVKKDIKVLYLSKYCVIIPSGK